MLSPRLHMELVVSPSLWGPSVFLPILSAYTIIFMQLCNYYGGQRAYLDCAGRDMINLF
jgi:hypothetical protein